MKLRRLRAVTRKEFLHILRDPRSLVLALALPLMMLLLFGYALSLDVDHIPTYIYDQDRTPESRALIGEFQGSVYFGIIGMASDYRTIERSINRSRCLMSVVIPRNFAKNLLAGKEANVQLLVDGSDSNTAAIAQGYAQALIQSYASELTSEARKRKGAGKTRVPVEARVRVWYNTDLKSRNYIVPGLIAVIMMIIAALLTSLTIAREWEAGTMEQLLSTPLRPAELVLGKLLAYFALGITDMAISIIVGVLVFDVPLRGNPLLLFFTGSVFLFGALCWGIFLSAVTRSQLVAYQMGVLTSFLPAFLLSGFIYSIGNMPAVIQAISYLVPARYFITILTGIFLKGVGLKVLWLEVVLLLLYATLVFVASTRALRKKVVV